MTDQHCPKCGGKEWFPGAACWDCGWEAPPCPACEKLVRELREALRRCRGRAAWVVREILNAHEARKEEA